MLVAGPDREQRGLSGQQVRRRRELSAHGSPQFEGHAAGHLVADSQVLRQEPQDDLPQLVLGQAGHLAKLAIGSVLSEPITRGT